LSVTPQVVNYADHREVRLSLQIQDGNFEGASVDQVPIVKQTEIDTEATVREGESLLVGGISVETDSDGTTGVPGLSRVPVLGALFRHREGSKSRSERIFLLTPKIVSVGRPLPAAAAASGPVATASEVPAYLTRAAADPDCVQSRFAPCASEVN
jgi:type III secretion protein C